MLGNGFQLSVFSCKYITKNLKQKAKNYNSKLKTLFCIALNCFISYFISIFREIRDTRYEIRNMFCR